MSTKTYSEQRQAIYFKAARDLYGVAAQILDDVTNDAELTGRSAPWAASVAEHTWKQAQELEDKGHEQAHASTRVERNLYAARAKFRMAKAAFEERHAEAMRRKEAKVTA